MKKSHVTALATAGIITGSAMFGGLVSAHGGPGGLMRGGPKPEQRQEMLQEQANWLGISEDQLWSELKDKSPKEVAQAHGKSEADIKQHRQDAMSRHKDERKQKLTDEFRAKGFSDEQIGKILEVLDANRPNHDQQN